MAILLANLTRSPLVQPPAKPLPAAHRLVQPGVYVCILVAGEPIWLRVTQIGQTNVRGRIAHDTRRTDEHGLHYRDFVLIGKHQIAALPKEFPPCPKDR